MTSLSRELQRDFLQRGFSRRSLGRLAALMAGGSALPFFNEFTLAQELDMSAPPAGVVKIDTNENPLGPCPEAIEAMRRVVTDGGRYMFHLAGEFQSVLAGQEKLPPTHVQAYPGSSMPLHWAVLAFTSPARPLVTADPGYEAAEGAARFLGARVIRVPLRRTDWAHDVKAMAAADANAGLLYICNPNNPTGTLTPRADLDYLIANKPAGAIVLLDEAYIHFAGESGASDMVAAGKDVIVLRTFSKLYGMAGLRAGAAMARPDLLAKLRSYGNTWMPATSVVGATASLKSASLVSERRKITRETREDVLRFLDQHGFEHLPSVSNHFLVDVKRPGREVMTALRAQNVLVGRSWPSLPTHIRVTVGTPAEMDVFKKAFLRVMA